MDVPGFQEARLQPLHGTHYRAKRIVFNRKDALSKAPPYYQELLITLFNEIDRTELLINYYDLLHGKRKTPPRASLTSRFSEEELNTLKDKAVHLNQKKYIQLKHYLVELRNEQYTYKDSFSSPITHHGESQQIQPDIEPPRFDADVLVFPFGLYNDSALAQKIFKFPPDPSLFSDQDLEQVSKMIWDRKPENKILDFEDVSHLLAIYQNFYILEEQGERDPHEVYSAAASIVKTLRFYESMADLTDIQQEILQMKIDERSNLVIQIYINAKYGTTYNENYISTIYRQKILPAIAGAATQHRHIMENIFYPENFKVCKDCGRLLLISTDFFMKEKKNVTGFAPRCKRCQKLKRQEKKV